MQVTFYGDTPTESAKAENTLFIIIINLSHPDLM